MPCSPDALGWMELYRVPYRVAYTSKSFPYTFGIYATAGVSTCTSGVYYGYATTTLIHFGMNPPSITDSVIGLPVYIDCAPPPPPGPGIPTPPEVPGQPEPVRTAHSGGASGWTPPPTPSGARVRRSVTVRFALA